MITSKKADSIDSEQQEEMKDLACFMCAEMGLCIATLFSSFIGLFFVGLFGLKDCTPGEFGSFCNYTENMSENKTTAIFILLLILASDFVSILLVCCNCRYSQQFGINLNTRMRRGPMVIVGGTPQGPVTTYRATNAPTVTETGYNYSTVVIGESGPNTAGQHFNYPTGTQPYNTQNTNPTISELQEQNRLLQEQIRLQQQQLELQQQLRQQPGQGPPMTTPMYTPPPPSYAECTSDESTIRQMQEQNEELQRRYQCQRHELEKQLPPPGPGLDPSAPPK